MTGKRRGWMQGWSMLLTLIAALAWAAAPAPALAQGDEEETAAEGVDEGAVDEEAALDEEAPPAAEKEPVEEIIVTGTRIGRSNLEDFAHITVVSAEDIALSGVNTIDELLMQLPSVTLQGISRQVNNGGNGWVMVDLRNLGLGRTLVLVNGRRFIKSNVGGAVDLNNIPVSMIERVEVLLDGASAVYGSDAIGGVINIILKDNFEGFQIDLTGGISGHGDGEELTVSGTGGVSGEHGNFTANFTYMHRNEVHMMDRDFSRLPVVWEEYMDDGPDSDVYRQYGSGTSENGRYIYPSVRDIDGDGVAGDLDNDWADVVMDPNGQTFHDYNGGGCLKSDGYGNCADPMGDRYNYNKEQWIMGQMERFSATVLGHYDFTENAKVYMEGTYTNRWSRNHMAAQPIGFGTTLYPDGMIMPGTDAAGNVNPALPDAIANDLNMNLPMLIGLVRMNSVGPRIMDNESDTMRLVTGVKGDITDFLSYDAYINYGHHQLVTTTYNSVNRTKMEESMNPDLCRMNSTRGCVYGKYFGSTISNALRRYISYTDDEITGWDMYVLAGLLRGELFELPGGMFTAVLGAETRKEWGFNRPSSITQSGDSAGNWLEPTEGSYNTQEVYAEINLPLLKDMTGAETVAVDLAARFTHYNTFGEDFTYRAGLTYAPLKDVRLRGVFSTNFRAPDISDLYGGTVVSYETLQDPCSNWGASSDPILRANCQAEGVPSDWTSMGSQIRTNIGGNPDLEAETAQVWNIGLVLTPTILPKYLKGFSASFDYYNITVDNAISGAEPQWLLDTCYASENRSHPNCAFVSPQRSAANELVEIDASLQNINKLETSGLDFTVNYGFGFDLFGLKKGLLNLDLGFHGNYLLYYDETNTTIAAGEEGRTVEYAGTITSGSGSYTKLRWNLYATLSGELGPGMWSLMNVARYIGGAKVFGVEWDETQNRWDMPNHHLSAIIYWDLVASYTWDRLTFIFGIDNVIDTDPPFFMNGDTNANYMTYDMVGRYFFTKISYKF